MRVGSLLEGRRAAPAAATALAALLLAGALLGVTGLNGRLRGYLLASPASHLTAERYQRNSHTRQEVTAEGSQVRFRYFFRDHKERDWEWSWAFDRAQMERDSAVFGVPADFLQPYRADPAVVAARRERMARGLFQLRGNTLLPDYEALIHYYMPYTRVFHDLAASSTQNGPPAERLQTLLRFMQDIPYGVPPDVEGGRMIAGLLPPTEVLTEAFGDCDSKAMLLASALAHDPAYQLLLLEVPNHQLLAVKAVPRPYQTAVTYQGERYVLLEAAGPGRVDMGDAFQRYSSFRVTRLALDPARARHAEGVITQPGRAVRALEGRGLRLVSDRLEGRVGVLTLRADAPTSLMAVLERDGAEQPGGALVQPLHTAGAGASDRQEYQVLLAPSAPGDYRARIFAKPKGRAGPYESALSYRFDWGGSAAGLRETPASGAGRPPELPKTYGVFHETGAALLAPTAGPLTRGREAAVRAVLPGAREGAVLVAGVLHPLGREAGDVFSGAVTPGGGPLILVGKYGSGNTFSYLAEFRVGD